MTEVPIPIPNKSTDLLTEHINPFYLPLNALIAQCSVFNSPENNRNQRFFEVFRGYRKETSGIKWDKRENVAQHCSCSYLKHNNWQRKSLQEYLGYPK